MGNKKSRVLAVDGNSILNRAYYGIRMLTTAEGLCTNAVYGMITMLKKQIDAVEPDHCVIAFDLKAPTFRHKMYDGYKANRKGMPDELAMQLPYAHECARAMGFHIIEREGFEADDILGTVSKFASGDCEVFVFTGDRDSLQLIDDNVKVLLAGNTDTTVYDGAKFEEKYGVRVDQFVDVKALMGDSSDNIPGVAGIGEKTAVKLIHDFESLDNLYEKFAESSLTAGVKNKLETGRENAFLSRTLAKINCEVDLGVSLDDIASGGIDKKAMLELCKKLEFAALIKKFELDTPEEKQAVISEIETVSVGAEDINSQMGICAFSYDGEKLYAVSEKEPHRVLVCEEPIDKTKIFLLGENVKTVCFDSKRIYKDLESKGIYVDNFYFDVMLGAYVLDPSGNFDLPRLVARYMNEVYSEDIPEAYYAMAIYKV